MRHRIGHLLRVIAHRIDPITITIHADNRKISREFEQMIRSSYSAARVARGGIGGSLARPKPPTPQP